MGGDFGDERGTDRFPDELVVLEPQQPDGAGQQLGPERCGTEAKTGNSSRDGELRNSQRDHEGPGDDRSGDRIDGECSTDGEPRVIVRVSRYVTDLGRTPERRHGRL